MKKKRKYQRRYHMWKRYTMDADAVRLGMDTYKLSMIAGKFEVIYEGGGIVAVKVRCNVESKAYNLCEYLGFTWR